MIFQEKKTSHSDFGGEMHLGTDTIKYLKRLWKYSERPQNSSEDGLWISSGGVRKFSCSLNKILTAVTRKNAGRYILRAPFSGTPCGMLIMCFAICLYL